MKRSPLGAPQISIAALCVIVATTIWLPFVHRLFRPDRSEIVAQAGNPPKAIEMAERHLELWGDVTRKSGELERMQRSNAEWDFMGRTFLVMALAEMAVRDPKLAESHLEAIDAIVDETLLLEERHGMHYFLMPYSRSGPYIQQPEHSLFVDSEIAMMLASRRMVAESPRHRESMMSRVEGIATRLRSSPSLLLESYPDECWLFDHAMALAAIRLADQLDHSDHSALINDWLTMARGRLIDSNTGLLISSFTTEGEPLDGPEGSSIWLTAHCLRLLDPELARDQFARAKQQLGRSLLGFAWSREWPPSWKGPTDVDSGAVIPLLDVSAGGSGLAFVAASSFGDLDLLEKLHTTLDFAAFPVRENGRLRYAASNQVGDSVMLYSLVLGAIWNEAMEDQP